MSTSEIGLPADQEILPKATEELSSAPQGFSDGTSTAPDGETSSVPALSKNAQKRILKEARRAEQKIERKAKDKFIKKEKQRMKAEKRAAGEALDEGEERAQKRALVQKQPFNARIVIDLGFDDKMFEKEVKSLCSQLSFTYGTNRRATKPFAALLHTSVNGRTKEWLDSLQNRDYLRWRGVDWWSKGYEYLWEEGDPGALTLNLPEPDVVVTEGETKKHSHKAKAPTQHKCDCSTVIYLTADSEEEITELKEGETYIIGGIVDRNRYKNLCHDKAIAQSVRTARLPIGTYISSLPTRKVLTVNQVFEIMLKWVEERDWEKAIMAVMPQRKFKDGKKKAGNESGGQVDHGVDSGEELEEEVRGVESNEGGSMAGKSEEVDIAATDS
ncbi:tRNA (guanine(9)-N(1))-methyltransferase [Tulasnella sp. JGI-2019a]|nr:tRNA (guanine(9)-N(1))-methyltransferase [Tulasnella sp. JGI-2019a]KAG8993336.1 tRNA (guanine(9)-N(1))-methyltransferase [Tulasnella sp. JGI-2019a]KAG9024536.1 tRNA (guanine(9)-N(1))-methyltransferase [Tulasnella sp. JGI-2019a]